MRVLQVTDGFPPEQWGGAEQFCARLSSWLARRGVDVHVAAPSAAALPTHWQLHKVSSKYLRKLFFDLFSPINVRRIRAIIAEIQPDVVHVHNIYGISSQLVHTAVQRCPTVLTVHGPWPVEPFTPVVQAGRLRYSRRRLLVLPWVWWYRRVHKAHLAGAVLVSPSRYLASFLGQFGLRQTRVIPNAVALPAARTRYDRSILFVGRLTPEKGLQVVLGPVERAARESGWQVDVVGDGPLRETLERAWPSVQFHGRADPAPFYQRASIVLAPSLWPDNFPYAVLEAMSYGVPVLASNVGGIPELVEDGVTGRLVEPGDGQTCGAILRELAGDRLSLEAMGRAAQQRVAWEFTWETVGPEYLQLYESISASGADTRSRFVDAMPPASRAHAATRADEEWGARRL